MEKVDQKPRLIPSRKLETPIDKISSPSSSEDDSPIRAVVCLKRIDDMKRFEETEDCFILEFDPFESVNLSKLSLDKKNPTDEDAVDLAVIAEKGKVACRDYPHSRHLCLKFPFNKTSHESHCDMCYCYVCDSAAPCKCWTVHCHADSIDYWKDQRKMMKEQQAAHT